MLQVLPKNIMKTIEEKRELKRKSKLDMATLPVQSVKIIDSLHSFQVGEVKNSEDSNDIDKDSLERAKHIVCGGETSYQKNNRILAEMADQEDEEDNGDVNEVQAVIAKSNDDLRQEVFVMQMIHYYKSVFINEGLPVWLKTYRILSTSKTTGMIELIKDATSIDSL